MRRRARKAVSTPALAEIMVLRASADEVDAHELVLGSLDKEVRGTCIWRTQPAV